MVMSEVMEGVALMLANACLRRRLEGEIRCLDLFDLRSTAVSDEATKKDYGSAQYPRAQPGGSANL